VNLSSKKERVRRGIHKLEELRSVVRPVAHFGQSSCLAELLEHVGFEAGELVPGLCDEASVAHRGHAAQGNVLDVYMSRQLNQLSHACASLEEDLLDIFTSEQ
jgi:hypothetical protein